MKTGREAHDLVRAAVNLRIRIRQLEPQARRLPHREAAVKVDHGEGVDGEGRVLGEGGEVDVGLRAERVLEELVAERGNLVRLGDVADGAEGNLR